MVRIELFGIPQLKAERKHVDVQAATVGAALQALARVCPALIGSVVDDDALAEGYVIALNGQQMTTDKAATLAPGDVLVLMSAQAGG